jgi:hypothetical protein
MASKDGPDWDVQGHIVVRFKQGSDAYEFRARCYDDGHATVEAEGVTFYVSPQMTAVEYLKMMFSRKMAPPGVRHSIGAMVAMCVLGLIAGSV